MNTIYCSTCGYIGTITPPPHENAVVVQDRCPECGDVAMVADVTVLEQEGKVRVPCEVYSRIVGYIRPVRAWNEGQQQAFSERMMFSVEKVMADVTLRDAKVTAT